MCVSCDLYPLNTRLHARARWPSLGLSFNFVQWRDRQSVTPLSTRYSAMSRTSRPSPRIPVRLIHFDWFEVMWVASSCISLYSATWHSLARYCHAILIPCPSQTIIWIYTLNRFNNYTKRKNFLSVYIEKWLFVTYIL